MRYLGIITFICGLGLATGSASDASRAEGRTLFVDNCAGCHGLEGVGDGPAGAGLATQPADLTRIAARRDGVWPMLEVMSIIDGYTKRTEPRDDMPIIEDIVEGPMMEFDTGNGIVTSVPSRLVALATYLESIQSPRPESYVP